CCRCIWSLFRDERSRNAVEVAERYADGLTSVGELTSASGFAEDASNDAYYRGNGVGCNSAAAAMLAAAGEENTSTLRNSLPYVVANVLDACAEAEQCSPAVNGRRLTQLLRCIFGTPSRPVPLDPVWLAWNDSTILKLAQTIYDERAFDRVPILADALEDA